jgi:four helix bundle protein
MLNVKIRNSKSLNSKILIQKMTEKIYDLEQRTFEFAKSIRFLFTTIQYNSLFENDIKQVIRSSGSVGANYIEANDKLSDKDFNHRIKICKKEAKETIFWLKLLELNEQIDHSKRIELIQEAKELMFIFGAILKKRALD